MIVETYRRLENFWFSINQKIRFLLVGGFNTGTSFLIYYAFLYITQGREQVSLLLMNVININISIMTMRYYVFKAKEISAENMQRRFLLIFCSIL